MAGKKQKKKGLQKKATRKKHDEAAEVLAAALLDSRKKKAARAHPVVGGIINKLGPTQFKQLSYIAKNQSVTTCPTGPTTGGTGGRARPTSGTGARFSK